MILINHHCSEWSLPPWHRKAPYATESPDTVKGALANRRRTYHEHFESNLGPNGVCECCRHLPWDCLSTSHLISSLVLACVNLMIQKQCLKKAMQSTLNTKRSLKFTWATTRHGFEPCSNFQTALKLIIFQHFFHDQIHHSWLTSGSSPVASPTFGIFGPGSRQAVHSATVPMTGSVGCQLDGSVMPFNTHTVPNNL